MIIRVAMADGKQSRRAADFLVKMRHQTFAPPMLPVGGSAAMPPIARLVIWNDQRVSSRGLWRTFHVQPPSRLGKARLYLASRQPVELPIPPSTHLLRESGQIQGFVTRTKAEPYDQIAGDRWDLFSRWVKEWQSHRGALVVSGLRKLDVAPSWLATSPSPDQ
jgi:hypothetical protein